MRFDDLKLIFESQASFSPKSNVAKRLERTFDYLDSAFEDSQRLLRNRTIIQSFATLAARIVEQASGNSSSPKFRAFFESFMAALAKQVELGQKATDDSLVGFQRTVNANVKSGAKIRHQVLIRKLLAHDPEWVSLLGPTALTEGALPQEIRDLSTYISERVNQLNEHFAAENGVDLFKATNKTQAATSRISKPIKGYQDYIRLVDDLYFMFHESTGTRLATKPSSFADINELRTAVRHDLDHGKAPKARKKRVKVAGAFKKYGGQSSPELMDPTHFVVVQANLLRLLASDLAAVAAG